MRIAVNTGALYTGLNRSVVLKHNYKPHGTKSALHLASNEWMNLQGVEVKEVGIGTMHEKNVSVYVFEDGTFGAGADGALGADNLLQQDVEINPAAKSIRLFRNTGCGNARSLAYWDADALAVPFDVREDAKTPEVIVYLNGKRMRARVDSGVARTYVYREGAETAGISMPAGTAAGQTVPARFEFTLGDETIKNAGLRVLNQEVVNTRARNVDMILGRDWLNAHRVLFASSQSRLYFSYLGGALFEAD